MAESTIPLQVPILETARLQLEPLTLKHSAGMFRLWSDARVCRYAGDAVDVNGHQITLPARTNSDSDKIIEFFHHHQNQGVAFRWAVVDSAADEFVGIVGFNSLGVAAEIAYHLCPTAWGRGCMTEACKAAMTWLQGQGSCRRLIAFIDAGNAASIRLALRLGMQATQEVRDGARCYEISLADPLTENG